MRPNDLAAWMAVLLLALASSASGQDAPRKTLPRLQSAGTSETLTGKIVNSTRGKPGPVRMVIHTSGRDLAVLVAPNDVCEALGLSLENGDEVTIEGRVMATGERPLMVTEAVIVDGERVPVRSASGGWVEVPEPKQGGASPTEEAEAAAPADS